MMSAIRRTAKSTITMVVFYGMAFTALLFGFINQSQIASESQQRTSAVEMQNAAIEAQNERIRIAFCGVAESIANGPQTTTAAGANIVSAFSKAASAGGVGCTADPLDRQ